MGNVLVNLHFFHVNIIIHLVTSLLQTIPNILAVEARDMGNSGSETDETKDVRDCKIVTH